GLALDEDHQAIENNMYYAKESIYLFVGEKENIAFSSNHVSQNYPNPASDYTYVNVEVNTSTTLQMEVYNLMGEKVMEINKGVVNPGLHRIDMNTSAFSSGIYFYTVFVEGKEVTKKMIIK
ncbi:MAG: T9SS type A sorting domain-containing protein, partial [Bacteroidales bacterium]|nr:T9SS type A sorting domain-containing protein [Bacteroidales bacterium]